ncbi:hypothetical protein PCC9214_01305 [Planktothrix tepida]|uniref:Calcium binding protein from Anabaena CcbP n=1 Tax=Planktothrix tepida PCC 9214 TaxID=671072 RepID=A0A1J1LG98_9CYAN|nr:calcium-binding protein [Planktothrix tepida]CAD5931338.1 hypothetical protein PCC9214_01305 [Planktothrix tepida]CUR31597.1 conserved hypothetical protein [Planktothrix tepida PCC 9214]
MVSIEKDESREERITYEIIVDAYDEQEVAMGWYYYLNDNINFPFAGKWSRKVRKTGKIQEKEVKVLGMASEDECLSDMYVEVVDVGNNEDNVHTVRLSDIEAIDPDEKNQQALGDWQYWIEQGYHF